ncbi:Endo-1,3(4)-beta-glucanase [Ceratocystis fimbriata CBS 114723]|uniref:Endo-1,3(4)-beta-glucanase n=1 Tax=Ceratocystis fimbriata CBS 114723 TaxID=1035309 RepID=A0A2C5X860_9PEZI|nr:Endo-1,3(4)-beta-glucanase [Ceratocystis fimbriata CBS 114723]
MSSLSKIAFSAVAAASLVSAGLTPPAPYTITTYKMIANFNDTNFFEEFEFFTDADPTHGYVEYVNYKTALDGGYAKLEDGFVYLGADHVAVNPPKGRMSTRLTSKQAFKQVLIIADISHMPEGPGIWPAFWSYSEKWPYKGEIDIIEGINLDERNHATLHTGPGCVVTNTGSPKDVFLVHDDCNYGGGSEGCSQLTNAPFGTAFNKIQGGVYAMDWTADYISMYFFPRDSIPDDITNEKPNPATWGTPTARFNGGPGCDINAHFQEHHMIFNTDFCGDWAGSLWQFDDRLTALSEMCKDFVGAHPNFYTKAYWAINSVKVYKATTEEVPKANPTGVLPASVSSTPAARAANTFIA